MITANPAIDVIKRGAASVAAATQRPAAVPRVPESVRFPSLIKETTDGQIKLVHAKTGETVCLCATRAIAEQTKATFKP